MRFNVERAVEKATKNSHFTGKQREDMMDALVESVKGLVTLKDAARSRNINVGTLQTYYHRARSMVEAVRGGSKPSHVMEMSASQASAAARKIKDDELGLFDGLDRNELSQEALCEEAVNRVIRSSLYPPEQKDRLRNSVNKVISGAMTINAAANLYGLPSSTVHPYVHRVRAALGDDCPPQAVGPTPHIYNFNGQKSALYTWLHCLPTLLLSSNVGRRFSNELVVHVGEGHPSRRAHVVHDGGSAEAADRPGEGRRHCLRACEIIVIRGIGAQEVVRSRPPGKPTAPFSPSS